MFKFCLILILWALYNCLVEPRIMVKINKKLFFNLYHDELYKEYESYMIDKTLEEYFND